MQNFEKVTKVESQIVQAGSQKYVCTTTFIEKVTFELVSIPTSIPVELSDEEEEEEKLYTPPSKKRVQNPKLKKKGSILKASPVSKPQTSESESEPITQLTQKLKEDSPQDVVTNKFDGPEHDLLTAIKSNDEVILKNKLKELDIPYSESRCTIASLSTLLMSHLYNTAPESFLTVAFPHIREIVSMQTQNLGQKSKRFCDLKTILKQRFGEDYPLVKSHVGQGLTREEFDTLEAQRLASRNTKLLNKLKFPIDAVDKVFGSKITGTPKDLYNCIFKIQLATGARFIEAVRESDFLPVEGEPNKIKIVGIAKKKKKGKDFEMIRNLYRYNSAELIDIVAIARDLIQRKIPTIDSLTTTEVTAKLITPGNARLKKLGLTGSHFLRKIYCQLLFDQLPEEERARTDQHLFIQQALGQEKMDSAANYAVCQPVN